MKTHTAPITIICRTAIGAAAVLLLSACPRIVSHDSSLVSKQPAVQTDPIELFSSETLALDLSGYKRLKIEGDLYSGYNSTAGYDLGLRSINRRRYIDPDGAIDEGLFAKYSTTGHFTYAVHVAGREWEDRLIKTVDFVNNGNPVLIATARRNVFRDRYGTTFRAVFAIAASKDLILQREDDAIVIISADKPTRIIAIPDAEAPHERLLGNGQWTRIPGVYSQDDDISFSRHLLLERYIGPVRAFGFADITNKDVFEYGMLNIDTGIITTRFTLTLRTGKAGASEDSGRQLPLPESLQQKFYLWNTTDGPIVITIEDGVNSIVARNLSTGDKGTLFLRESSGISSWTVGEHRDTGKLTVVANWQFKDISVPDVVAHLAENRAPITQ